MLTANKISIIPTALFTVKSSLNTKTPITTAALLRKPVNPVLMSVRS
nr:MAG TPA: hypothetical protein [Caudoviricetes sp.]